MDKSRRERELIYHRLYVPLPYSIPSVCAYCGLPSASLDHCPPLSTAYSFGTEYLIANKVSLYLIPSCFECNVLLGSKVLLNYQERKAFIAKRLRRRYARILKLPAWSDDDIDGLGRGLKSMVKTNESLRKLTVRRLAFAEET